MSLYIAGYDISLQSANGIAFEIYFAGCPMVPKCKGCHNPELWEPFENFSEEEILKAIDERKEFLDYVVLMGGEPLGIRDLNVLYDFISLIRVTYPDLMIKLYSGYNKKQIEEDPLKLKILSICDEWFLGPYNPDKPKLFEKNNVTVNKKC